MGCCFSNEENTEDDINDVHRPLINPVDGPSSRPQGYNAIERPQQKGDEQSALNRILQETASNVIDVAALETHGMDQLEYQDREKQYRQRLAVWGGNHANSQRLRTHKSLPAGVMAPQAILASNTVSLADIQLISHACQTASKALKEVKVKHKEDLVVPFGVP